MRQDRPSVSEDRRLTRLTEICLALPQATREYNGQHATFRVRDKTFAYYLDNHRGDEGIVGVVCKAPWGENDALVSPDPNRFYKPAYVGPRGWVGLRLDTGEVDWTEVADLVADSYVLVAPKRLAALVEGASST
jgi:predicted DNA-binding protein (MmcQ/YjbR family)